LERESTHQPAITINQRKMTQSILVCARVRQLEDGVSHVKRAIDSQAQTQAR